ncbi:MAG TPA: hypothetical protein DEB37_15380 [Lysinibacillus sp.]|nr:hypothetical protein [Lysinibacillus sp.]
MKNLLIFLLLVINIGNDNFEIEGLSNNYYTHENIQFYLTNNSSSKKFYYISVDCYDNKTWSELINDVNNPKSNKSLIMEILPSKRIKVNFPINKVFYMNNFLNFKLYRLKIVYGDSIQDLNYKYYSESFKIKRCKN